MSRRWFLLTGALAIALAAPQASAAMAAPGEPDQQRVRPERASDAEDGLARLRADAVGRLKVHRATDGAVDFVSSTNGRAMLDGDEGATPRRSAQDQLARYGETFGIDGGQSRAVVKQTLDSATGGSIVRADQVVDGVPVFGGQIVMSLDEDQGVVSVDTATTEATEVPAALVSEARAQRAALAVTAKSHKVGADALTATGKGRRLYDPAIVHTSDPMGVRPVWEFEVTNGSDIRERVLVGTDRGEIALHFNDAPAINRVICDNANRQHRQQRGRCPQVHERCGTRGRRRPARGTDVNKAYDNLGATSDAYSQLAGIDLTELVGTPASSGQKALMSTVRWCFEDDDLPVLQRLLGRDPDGVRGRFRGRGRRGRARAHPRLRGAHIGPVLLPPERRHQRVRRRRDRRDRRPPQPSLDLERHRLGGRRSPPGRRRTAQPEEPSPLRPARQDEEHPVRQRRHRLRRRCRARQQRRRQQDRLPDLAGRHLQRPDRHRDRQRRPLLWPRPVASTSTSLRGSPPVPSTPTSGGS